MSRSNKTSYNFLITRSIRQSVSEIEHTQQITRVIHAAGGVVLNPANEILFIYRNKHWELPKGWIEKGESQKQAAIREVSEECGISDLQIQKRLPATFHIYQESGSSILKITHWFLMLNISNEKPVPQTEEGISKVQWLSYKEYASLSDKVYPNLKELMEYVGKSFINKF